MNYNDGKWHGWNGGECPVHPETVVEAIFDDGTSNVFRSVKAQASRKFYWEIGSTIVAFRVIKEHKEPREFWIVKVAGELPEVHGHKPIFHDGIEVIHVREVLDDES